MKNLLRAGIAGMMILAVARGQSRDALLTVSNLAAVARVPETVEVPLTDLQPLTGGVSAEGFVVRLKGSPEVLPSQVTANELLFQSEFLPGQTKEFTVTRGASHGTTQESRVAGMFVPPREDYAWENDRIAFRMYGPALAAEVNNGIDVWTKRVRSLIVGKWYREAEGAPPGKDPYHHDRGEGADFFDVGRSLGAGGCALWHDGKVVQPGVFSTWKTLSNGPVRIEFELTYKEVTIGGIAFVQHKRISLDAGQNLNRVRDTFDSPSAGTRISVACGLVKRPGTAATRDTSHSWMGLWGRTNADTVNGYLGTGVVCPPSTFSGFAEDSSQFLLVSQTASGTPLVYYAGAGWTRSGDFSTEAEWRAYLDAWSIRAASPLRVRCASR